MQGLKEKIEELKRLRGAVILAHNYQPPEIQDIADFTGDSLALSIRAAETQEGVIVFCGVGFMADTAAVLAYDKVVLNPEPKALCPMANMISREELCELKESYPGAGVMCYVNSKADIKAESDICCTSSNSKVIADSFFTDKREIIFVPDRNLALNTARDSEKDFINWRGYCPTHVKILPEHIYEKKRTYPEAEVLVHPECRPEVCSVADHVLSTGQMSKQVESSDSREFIIGTEIGMVYRLKKDNPEKRFYSASDLAVCPNMKKNTLGKILRSLREMHGVVEVEDSVREGANRAISGMFEISSERQKGMEVFNG